MASERKGLGSLVALASLGKHEVVVGQREIPCESRERLLLRRRAVRGRSAEQSSSLGIFDGEMAVAVARVKEYRKD